MNNIQLVFVHEHRVNQDDEIINNAPCVPVVGTEVETNSGACEVQRVKYDFAPNSGSCRVYIYLALPNAMRAFS